MKRLILLASFAALLTGSVYSQARIENRLKFSEAEGMVLFEEYQEALKIYLQLIKSYPTNANLKYRIGQCYINIPSEKEKAIGYLEEAVQKINPKYREGKFRETRAPYDAYYYLANAYRINNQLEKALETYNLFSKNLNKKVYDTSVVNLQIKSCLNAMEMMKKPLYIRKENLGNLINDQYPETNPVISGDKKSMVYNRLTPFQEVLFYLRNINGKWSEPRNIITDLGLGQEFGNFATSLSYDGKELYIYRRGLDYDGNIYVTRLKGENWSNITKLNDNINTKYWESHATLSHDGKKLYFTSNRKDAIGGLDIFVSERDSGDAWGPAKNLGPVINTKYNEDTPFLSSDDKTLFFSSAGHHNIGGYDVFYSTLQDDGNWSIPLNAGYPLNTTDDDLFFHPVDDGYEAYYSLTDKEGYGLADIYLLKIFSDDHPRKFTVKGIARISRPDLSQGGTVNVTATSTKDPLKIISVYTDPLTGEYIFDAEQGEYRINYEAPNRIKTSSSLNISLFAPSDTILLDEVNLSYADLIADLVVEKYKFTLESGFFRLRTETKSSLTIKHLLGDSILFTTTYPVDDTLFIYKMLIGKTDKVTFSLTDQFGNSTTVIVPVIRAIPVKVVRPEYSAIIEAKKIEASKEKIKTDTTKVEAVKIVEEKKPVVVPPVKTDEQKPDKSKCLWYIWLILGAGILTFLIILVKRRKDKSTKQK